MTVTTYLAVFGQAAPTITRHRAYQPGGSFAKRVGPARSTIWPTAGTAPGQHSHSAEHAFRLGGTPSYRPRREKNRIRTKSGIGTSRSQSKLPVVLCPPRSVVATRVAWRGCSRDTVRLHAAVRSVRSQPGTQDHAARPSHRSSDPARQDQRCGIRRIESTFSGERSASRLRRGVAGLAS